MKDLKHIYELETLLQEAHNDLIRQARSRGEIAIGSTCSLIPEPLINLPGCFSVRLRAPRTGSIEMGTYYMTSIMCEACRAILERAIEGGYQFLDCMLTPDSCAQMNRCVENIEHLQLCANERFFVTYADVPMKSDETALRHYVRQMRQYVLEPLGERFSIDTSDEALQGALTLHNQVCRLLTDIGDFRREENPRITGYEFAVLCLATYCCPKEPLIPILEETLAELQGRQPDQHSQYRARVVLAGSEIDDPELIRMIEEAGALVVADRFCLGSLPGRQEIKIKDGEDILTGICRHYMEGGQCPRFMNTDKIRERHEYMDSLAKRFRADGIIYQQIKFCDYWGYERAYASRVMREDYGYPVLSIDRPYAVGNAGQLRTRVQAFVESLEIKKLKGIQETQAKES
ncbi:MAG: 2-hydroxyacyl-CoA dehydratase family protein [bacterium]|nr:2-hydroxyacyl-CoA dehydratase family protein [bacterium]MCM1375495.1 2-hydroxyacyl-CoA dehydratase family protein [Muribaculum sp.]